MAIRKKRDILVIGDGRLALFSLAFFGNGKGAAYGYCPDENECARLNELIKATADPDLKKALLRKRLYFVSDPKYLVESNIFVLAYDQILEANEETLIGINALLKDNANDEIYLVIRSLAKPGTARKIREFCKKEHQNKRIYIISIPNLSDPEPSYIEESNPYRVMFGSIYGEGKLILSYYNDMRNKGAPIYEVSNEEAEIASLASKIYLSQKSAFGASLLKEANKEGASVDHLIELLGSDPRISRRGLHPKDLFDYGDMTQYGDAMPEFEELIETQRQETANDLKKLLEDVLGSLIEKKIAIIGLGKAGLYDSWAQRLYGLLKNENADLMFFDFSLSKENEFKNRNPSTNVSNDFFECVKNADALVIFDGSSKFRKLMESDLLPHMRGRIIFDYAKALNANAFKYFDIYRFGTLAKKRLSEQK